MTLVCYFYKKPTQYTTGPVPKRGMVRCLVVVGDRGLFWSIDGKSSKDKNQYLQGWMEIPSASRLVVSRSLAAFLLCCFQPWVPFISCQNPSFTALILELFIIKTENRGNHPGAVGNFGIHHMIVHLLHTLSCNLFFCTSLVPLYMWVSVCVCL